MGDSLLEWNVMISIKYNFIFIHVPKTAGNSFQNILKNYSEDKIIFPAPHQDGVERFELESIYSGTRKHSSLFDYKEKVEQELFDKAYKFTCVRNPWDRMISFYFSPHRCVNKWDREDFLKFIEQVPPTLSYLSLPSNNLENILNNFDYIVRFESLESGFLDVCDALGILDKTLPVRNKANKKHYKYYYDQELVEKVSNLFKDEIELFGYSF